MLTVVSDAAIPETSLVEEGSFIGKTADDGSTRSKGGALVHSPIPASPRRS